MKKLLGSTWIEINLDLVKQNIKNIKNTIDKQAQIMGVVKGNAYGHDSVEISKTLIEQGVEQLAVARIEEAIILRNNNINAPILVLSVSLKEQLSLYLDYNIMPTISNLEIAKNFDEIASKYGKKLKVHLKIETGMGRLGIMPEVALNSLKKIKSMDNIDVQGIYTHFSTADEDNKEYTDYQFKTFSNIMNQVKKNNINIPFFHVANSGTILDLPNMWLDLIRPGCIIYGLYPSNEVSKTIQLFPALSFKSRIAFIKKLESNRFIGYGRTYKTKKSTLIATLPVGYADGYSRLLSNRGKVLVSGVEAPVIGRVCMDQMMIDITDIPKVDIGDEVVLWGEQMGKTIAVEDIAKLLNTIVDEVVHLTDKPRVAKLFIKDRNPWKIKNMLGEYYLDGK
jgi:alanine racemase